MHEGRGARRKAQGERHKTLTDLARHAMLRAKLIFDSLDLQVFDRKNESAPQTRRGATFSDLLNFVVWPSVRPNQSTTAGTPAKEFSS
jgi:hypothetical protein